jgi:hypothetical protein
MNGILHDGWGFVYAAYGLTALILASYVTWVARRSRPT